MNHHTQYSTKKPTSQVSTCSIAEFSTTRAWATSWPFFTLWRSSMEKRRGSSIRWVGSGSNSANLPYEHSIKSKIAFWHFTRRQGFSQKQTYFVFILGRQLSITHLRCKLFWCEVWWSCSTFWPSDCLIFQNKNAMNVPLNKKINFAISFY